MPSFWDFLSANGAPFGVLTPQEQPYSASTGNGIWDLLSSGYGGLLNTAKGALNSADDYAKTGNYNPGPVVDAAMMALGGASPFASEGALGAMGGKISQLSDKWNQQGIRNFIADRPSRNQYQLSDLVVPEDKRGTGLGSAFMKELTDIADSEGRVLTLTAAKDYGTTSLERLKDFYKGFGFIENRGRNKDFTISDSMYRPIPKGRP